MATLATIAGFKLKLGTDASPVVYTDIEEVISVGALGNVAENLDVTNFDSAAGQREFIAGLAEGNEMTIECNDINAANQIALDAAQGTNRYFQAVWTGVSPNRTITLIGSIDGIEYTPSTTEQNKVTFTVKISSWDI